MNNNIPDDSDINKLSNKKLSKESLSNEPKEKIEKMEDTNAFNQLHKSQSDKSGRLR